jgi:hypothetical protein
MVQISVERLFSQDASFLPVQRGSFFSIRRSIDQLENIESDVRP